MARSISWRTLCAQVDEDFENKATEVVQYEFTSPGGKSKTGTDKTHRRVGNEPTVRTFARAGTPYSD